MKRKFPFPLRSLGIVLCLAFAHSAHAQSAEPLQKVVPINVSGTTGSITVGSTVYSGANSGLHMVALSRQPDLNHLDAPDLIKSATFTDASSANQFLENALATDADAILIVNAVGSYGFGPGAIAGNLHQFGAAHDIDSISSPIPFVFIGNGGLNSGGARQRGFSNRDLSGYLATDSNGNYTFIQTDYLKFDIGLDGTVNIGASTYTVAGSGKVSGCSGSNAFHVVAVQRDVPTVVIVNESYCTAQSDSEIRHIITDLSSLVGSESNLVFIASSGHPIPANWNFGTDGDARIYPLAQLIARLGGYWETMVYLTPSDTYSLVGATAPPAGTPGARKRAKESSSVYPGHSAADPNHATGELHGILARGRGNWYSPLTIDPTGQANLGFYQILAQQPVPFPHPASSAELAAFQYISNQLCGNGCNVRNEYPNTNVSVNDYLSKLSNMTGPQGENCKNTADAGLPFCIVQQQLLTEFGYVADIRSFNSQLQDLWLASGTTSILEMLSTYNKLQANLPAPPAAPAPSLMGPIVNLFLGLASAIPEVGTLCGIADTAFNFGMSLTTDASGNNAVSLASTVSNLQQQAATLFAAQGTTTGTQFDFIYQDWGKISSLGTLLTNAQPGSAWFWDTSATGQILQAMAPAIEESYYQSLMSALYAVGSYLPVCYLCPGPVNWGGTPIWQQPQAYTVNDPGGPFSPGETPKAQPFNYPWFPPYTFPSDATNPVELPSNPAYTQASATLLADNAWLGISAQTSPSDSGSAGLYNPPAASILSHLFTPRSQQGLGVYRPAFFEGWPFPRITCDTSDDGSGDPGQGCNWGAAAPPPEALPAPVVAVMITPGKLSVDGMRLDVPLTITNSGTVELAPIKISEISFRTLAGSGEATLIDPGLPIHVGALMPGSLTKITLSLNIPSTVKKLALTETGSIKSIGITPYKFSLGQIVFPSSVK